MTIIQAEEIMTNHPDHQRADHNEEYGHGSAFINGEYCSIDKAGIPITDLGFIHADAAYDVVSASKGYIFRLDDHLDRFKASCDKFLLENPYSREETAEILTNMVKLAGTKDAYIWWCVTRGSMPEGADRTNLEAFQSGFYGFVTPYMYIAGDEARTRGMNIIVSKNYIRIPPNSVDPTAKNFHWMDMKLSMVEAILNGGDNSVLCDADGYLAESPGANIFLISDGTLYTPDSGCLEGITRKTTLELADEIGMPSRVERVHVDQLRDADEAFITSTAGGIMPASSIDGVPLKGTESGPGEFSSRIHDLYWEKRWSGWLGTPVDFNTPVNIHNQS